MSVPFQPVRCAQCKMAESSPTIESGSPVVSSFDIELLIDCVKSRRLIWDPSHVEYKNRNKKKEEWAAICRVIYEDFDDKPDVEKNKICKELQLKWKGIRDSYQRSVRAEKKKSGDAAKVHRQYLYARQMEFLKSAPSHNRTEDSTAIDSPQSEVTLQTDESLSESPHVSLQQTPSTSTMYRRNKKNLEENLQKYMTAMTKQTEETLSKQKDDDYHFLLSILPTMKQFSDIDKLKLRCDILQLVMKYKEQSKCDQPTPPPFNISSQTVNSQDFPQSTLPNFIYPVTDIRNFPLTRQSPSPSYQSTGTKPTSTLSSFLKPTTGYSSTIADQYNNYGNPMQSAFSPIQPAERTPGYHAEYGSSRSDVLPIKLPSFKTKAKNKRQRVNLESPATVTSGALAAQESSTLATEISRAICSPDPDSQLSINSNDSLLSL